MSDIVKIKIDGYELAATAGTTVLRTALDNGIDIPHFCYHPGLTVSGNCRMCAVEIEGISKLEISCNLPVKEGLVVKTDTERIRKHRQAVLEFLLINHPLDCPICDQAGECFLQDYYQQYSGQTSRFREEKLPKLKAYPVGPQIMYDGERCVLCQRCVRFCEEISKTRELTVRERGDASEIDVAPGKVLDNKYALNTVDICPVGALTSKDFRFKKRAWFLTSSASVCPQCSQGCNIYIDHEKQTMYRWRPRHNSQVNHYWLCDEGRLAYREWQGESRITRPQKKGEGGFQSIGWSEALKELNQKLFSSEPGEVVVVLSAQATNEEIAAAKEFFAPYQAIILTTAREKEGGEDDDRLIRADKNPNRKALGDLNKIETDYRGSILFVADGLGAEEWAWVEGGFDWVVQLAFSKEQLLPDVDMVLPWATFAEKAGSFTNFEGKVQSFAAAIRPAGEAKSLVEIVEKLKT